jgi:hypothetical protein
VSPGTATPMLVAQTQKRPTLPGDSLYGSRRCR